MFSSYQATIDKDRFFIFQIEYSLGHSSGISGPRTLDVLQIDC